MLRFFFRRWTEEQKSGWLKKEGISVERFCYGSSTWRHYHLRPPHLQKSKKLSNELSPKSSLNWSRFLVVQIWILRLSMPRNLRVVTSISGRFSRRGWVMFGWFRLPWRGCNFEAHSNVVRKASCTAGGVTLSARSGGGGLCELGAF